MHNSLAIQNYNSLHEKAYCIRIIGAKNVPKLTYIIINDFNRIERDVFWADSNFDKNNNIKCVKIGKKIKIFKKKKIYLIIFSKQKLTPKEKINSQ